MTSGNGGSIWILGAKGFLGRHVARHFFHAGWHVAGIGHGNWPVSERQAWGIAHWLEADVSGPALEAEFAHVGTPDVVLQCCGSGTVAAAFADPLADFYRSVGSTAAVLDFLRKHAPEARLILASSAAVYGNSEALPICEDACLRPSSIYGIHKEIAERLCFDYYRLFGQKVAIIRYFSIYGPGLEKQLLWDIATKLKTPGIERLELFGTGTETRDMIHVEDAAALVGLLARTPGNDFLTVNGGTGASHSIREIAEIFMAELNIHYPIYFNGQARSGDPKWYQANVERVQKLGFTPQYSLTEGLRSYVTWLKIRAASAGKT